MWNGHNHILTENEPFLGLVFSYFNKKRLPHNQLNRLIVQQPLAFMRLCAKLRQVQAVHCSCFEASGLTAQHHQNAEEVISLAQYVVA